MSSIDYMLHTRYGPFSRVLPREGHYNLTSHLDRLAGKLEEARYDEHHAGVYRVKRSDEGCVITGEVLLVVNETLREERRLSFADVVDYDTASAELLDEARSQQVTLNDVNHLRSMAGIIPTGIDRVSVKVPRR